MWMWIFLGAALALLALLQLNGLLTPSVLKATSLYVRAALGPLLKRGWQKNAAKEGFALKAVEVSYPFTIDLERLAKYITVCQIPMIEKFGQVPILFPEAMCISSELLELLLGPDYPLPVLGSVHVRNWTRQERAIRSDESLTMTAKILPDVAVVKRGSEVTTELVLTAKDNEVVWRCRLVYLVMHRHRKTVMDTPTGAGDPIKTADETATWSLPENMGRVYGGVSMDINPIHLHAVAAKAFGFPRAIAHGLYTSARAFASCMDFAQQQLNYPIEAEVFFKKPVLLPSKSQLLILKDGNNVKFNVTSVGGDRLLIEGTVKSV